MPTPVAEAIRRQMDERARIAALPEAARIAALFESGRRVRAERAAATEDPRP